MACISKRRGRYVIDFYDHTGKRRWETLPEGATKTKARERLRELEDQVARRLYLPDKKVPLFKDVAKDWIKHKKANLRESTYAVYEGHTRNHFKTLDGLKVNRITTATIERFISDKRLAGIHILTLRKVLVTLNQILTYAVRHKLIDYNPVRDAERPKDQRGDDSFKIRILNPDEIQAFLGAVEGQKYQTLFTLAVMSGMRQGEVLGLKWQDIDWISNQVHVQRTFNNQAWYKPKTRTSNRKIDLGPSTMLMLRRWKLACPPGDLIFPNEAGQPMNHSNLIARHFNPALKAAGLPVIRFHDLRHAYASFLIEQGENLKYIQTQLGHSSPSVTLNVYAHLMKSENQEAAHRLENMVLNGTGSRMVAPNEKGLAALTANP